jgi:hypothetical protein
MINYRYEILDTDEFANCMHVKYTIEGKAPAIIGTRLPYEGEPLEAVIQEYSPVRTWFTEARKFYVPDVGTTGTVTMMTHEEEVEDYNQRLENHKMWEQVDFEKKIAKALLKFGVLETDPTMLQVTHL